MLTVALLLAQLQAPIRSEPIRIVRDIQAALDGGGGRDLERVWRGTLARRPRDPRALLAVSVFERSHLNYERVDSLMDAIDRVASPSNEWRAIALIGRGAWRALGLEVQVADSMLSTARAYARAAADPDIEAEALLVLMQVRGRTQGPRVGKQLLDEWWSLLKTPAPRDTAARLCLGAAIDDQLGDTTALARAWIGAAISERERSWRMAGNCRLSAAQISERKGYHKDAASDARGALQHFRHIDFAPGIALASQWYGYIKVSGHDYASGRALLEEAVVAARRTRFEAVEAWAHVGLAQMYLNLGDIGRARQYAAIGAASHARRGDLWGLANSRRFEAAAMEAAGDLAGAAERYAAAQQVYVRARIPSLAMVSLVSRAAVLLRLGALDSAEAAIAQGAEVGRTIDSWRITEEPQLRGLLALRRNQLTRAESLFRSVRLGAEWRKGNWHAGSAVMALREAQVALRLGNVALADTVMAGFAGALERWRRAPGNQGLTASLAQLGSTWSGLAEVYPDLIAQLVARDRVADAFALVERLRARDVVERRVRAVAFVQDSTVAARALRPGRGGESVVTLAELRRSLAPDEAMVTYVLGVDGAPTTAFVVAQDTVLVHRLPGRDVIAPILQRFAHLAARGTEATGASRQLGDALLGPVFASLPARVRRLIVSPDGDLHRVPFDALLLADGRYALERVAFSTAPSATALLALRAAAPSAGERVVAVGDPRYASPARRGDAATDPDRAGFAGARLARLRHSGDEARRAARYGRRSTVLTGSQATEPATIRAASGDVAVLHIAAHGLIDDGSQFNTALAVAPGAGADGFLTASELARLELKGPLVVLSACRSSGGVVLGGEGLRGLTAPLLEAGARAVVGTHWSIGDRSVVPFIERFYRAMAEGARPDDALRTAKLAAIRAGVSIADWASFTITGDASVRPPLRRPAHEPPAPWLRNVVQAVRDTSLP